MDIGPTARPTTQPAPVTTRPDPQPVREAVAAELPPEKAVTAASEGRAAHWLLLIVADRVDAGTSHLRSLLTLHPDNPLTETGVIAELKHHGVRSRFGAGRADVKHQWLDPIIVAGPWVLAGVVTVRGTRRVVRFARGEHHRRAS